ncbi:hypothetical protein ACYCVF_33930 [Bradyrhizobium sp. 1.29L]
MTPSGIFEGQRLGSLRDACAAVEAQIVNTERKIATETEREERDAAAKEITATADVLQEGLESVLRELRRLGENLTPVEHLSLETFNFGHFLRKTAGEIEAASAITPPYCVAWQESSNGAKRQAARTLRADAPQARVPAGDASQMRQAAVLAISAMPSQEALPLPMREIRRSDSAT